MTTDTKTQRTIRPHDLAYGMTICQPASGGQEARWFVDKVVKHRDGTASVKVAYLGWIRHLRGDIVIVND
jgi:hypothetical protein